jgi:hypothetical protein
VSGLTIPVRPPRAEDAALAPFAAPEGATPIRRTMLEPEHHNWWVKRDLASDVSTLEVLNDEGVVRLEDIDLEVGIKGVEFYSARDDEFDSPRGETRWERGLRRGDWSVRTFTRTVLTSTATEFHIHADLDAYEGDKRVFTRSWDETVPRDLV